MMKGLFVGSFEHGRRPTPEGRRRALEASRRQVEAQLVGAQKFIDALESGRHRNNPMVGRLSLAFARQAKEMGRHRNVVEMDTIAEPAKKSDLANGV